MRIKRKPKYEDIPNVTTLGDGYYSGTMSGYVLEYKGKKYMCSFGVRGINQPMTVIVKDGNDYRF